MVSFCPRSPAEGFQSWMWRGLTFLLPFLFFGHVSGFCVHLAVQPLLWLEQTVFYVKPSSLSVLAAV